MGSFYRSEEMRLCQLIVEKDAAFTCVAELGKHPFVHFKDLNVDMNAFQRMFLHDIQRLDEMERKLREGKRDKLVADFLEDQITNDQIFAATSRNDEDDCIIMPIVEINQLETTLVDLERDVLNMNESDALLRGNFVELREWEAILEKTDEFFAEGMDEKAQVELEQAEVDFDHSVVKEETSIAYAVGVIRRDRVVAFERVLWRVCHHTAYVRTSEIEEELEDPDTVRSACNGRRWQGECQMKSVFIVFIKGVRIKSIIDKVCAGFKAKLYYNCPRTVTEQQAALVDVRTRIRDFYTVLGQTREHRYRVLQAAASNRQYWLKQVNLWTQRKRKTKLQIRMQKAVYEILNHFSFDGNGSFIAECWIPLNDIEKVREALERGAEQCGSTVRPLLNVLRTQETPPTYNKTNKFMAVFQGIVDAYGVASYREISSAPFTIITIPFIFSLMFGDVGHGCIMLLVGLFFVLREKALIARIIKDEIFDMLFGGRYLILLMGLFSIYAGFIYNEIFSKSMQIFGSSWRNCYSNHTLIKFMHHAELYPPESYLEQSGPYWLGVDPVWQLADNKLTFLNSMKMKISVIVGVAQMTFGLFLSFNNYRFFNSNIDIYTVFVPQIIFLACIFMYLCLQIILKWIFFGVQMQHYIFGNFYPGSVCAPSLLIGFIYMLMMQFRDVGFVDDSGRQFYKCDLNQWYPDQSIVETFLVLIALGCIPVMLFGKPIYFLLAHTKKNHYEETFGDVMLHQAIHTIEYVLGCVSHTASYLRLWALSLAHAQLSEVLWSMLLSQSFTFDGISGYIALYIICFVFGVLTFSILVLMEGLSAFLHTLRLHWVEFQTKFYHGRGYPFKSFYFNEVFSRAESGPI